MRFVPTPLEGAYVVESEPFEDVRGGFARAFCTREFEARGLESRYVQCNMSWNVETGTLRGLHSQRSPKAEVKLIRCTRGAIFDVIVDVRPDSPTCRQWFGVELTAANRQSLYVPRGFAHGYQTLERDSEVYYLVSEFYAPDLERGYRWDDPAFGIAWPSRNPILSDKDRAHQDYAP